MKDAGMNADQLLAYYERIADAPDAIGRLRRFILDLAVRGKLVEQDLADEPASALLKRIAAEKGRLKIKHPISPVIADEPPYDLPHGWCWSRIGELCSKTGSGSTPRGGKEVYKPTGVPFLRSQNVYDDGLRLADVACIAAEVHARMSGTKVLAADLLLNITGGSIGRCCQVPDDFDEANISQHVAIVRPAIEGMSDFLHKLILSPYFQAFVFSEQTGAGRGGLPKNRMDRIVVALPPLAEQHRIVAKVDELMDLCDRLETARAEREARRDRLTAASLARLSAPDPAPAAFQTHAAFALANLAPLTTRPDQIKQLRQTILNLAVRGKLVEQDPADEPASALLKRITIQKPKGGKQSNLSKGSSLPFTLPMGWSWTTLSEISTRLHYGYTASADVTLKDVRLLRITDIQDSRVNWEAVPGCAIDEKSLPKYLLEVGDMLIARTGGTIGKTFLVKEAPLKAVFASYLIRVTPSRELLDQYIKTFCESGVYWDQLRDGSRGGGQPNVNGQTLGKMFVPLPPLAEQHRIVAKVDALMALCDQLEASLTTTAATRSKLLGALLHEALLPGESDMEAA